MKAGRQLTAVAATAALALLAVAAPADADWGTGSWVEARATFYGRDAWPLHDGECGFGFICPDRWTDQLAEGYDVVAVSDKSNLFTGAQCGQCLEIKCRDGSFTDGYGAFFTRTGLCKPGYKSVKVKIVDECPCDYPANAYSNKRWCCGDMPHLDVSEWALEKIVDDPEKWGVFAIAYRTIPCDVTVENEAANLPDPAPDPHANMQGSTNCADQDPKVAGASAGGSGGGAESSGSGGLSTESTGSVARATISSGSSGSSSDDVRHAGRTYTHHSRKFWARREAYRRAEKFKHSKAFYAKLEAHFALFSPDMKRISRRMLAAPQE